MTPDYYCTPHGDLYDLWLTHFGEQAIKHHLLMSALEYLWRAPFKGSYLADLQKVSHIVDQLLAYGPLCAEDDEATLRTLAAKLGYGLVCLQQASGAPAPLPTEAVIAGLPCYLSPWPDTTIPQAPPLAPQEGE